MDLISNVCLQHFGSKIVKSFQHFIDISASVIAITFVIGLIIYLCGYRKATPPTERNRGSHLIIYKKTLICSFIDGLHTCSCTCPSSKYCFFIFQHVLILNKCLVVDGNDEHPGGILRRRHSTGVPFQFAKVAKDFIRNRGRYRRQFSEVSRESLPKPPTEYFEPSELPEIPQNLRPEFFYLRHNIK